jgi:hypothetical protein
LIQGEEKIRHGKAPASEGRRLALFFVLVTAAHDYACDPAQSGDQNTKS